VASRGHRRGLSPAVAKSRKRLAARFSSLGFPVDGCMQSLKETGCDLDKTCRLLLYYYPRGDGMRTMVHNLTALIKKVETKMRYVLEDIQASVSSGTPEERLATLRTHFDACDEGDKEYLSLQSSRPRWARACLTPSCTRRWPRLTTMGTGRSI
jgi:hypothetical protein